MGLRRVQRGTGGRGNAVPNAGRRPRLYVIENRGGILSPRLPRVVWPQIHDLALWDPVRTKGPRGYSRANLRKEGLER